MVEMIGKEYQPKISIEQGSKEFAKLHQIANSQGILDRSYLYYSLLIPLVCVAYAIVFYAIYHTTDYVLLSIYSLLLVGVIGQFGGLLHDGAHACIFKKPGWNMAFSIFFGWFIGLNYWGWRIQHNEHHVHPNLVGVDNDMDLPYSFSKDQYLQQKGIAKLLRKYQSYLFLPSLTLALASFQISRNIEFLIREIKKGWQWKHIFFIANSFLAFFLWYVVPFLLFAPAKAIFIVTILTTLAGFYVGNIFAPNHKTMPQISPDAKLSYLEMQIITTLNIEGSPLNDFLYVGTNYQIEHHLFPSCPRNKLKLIKPHLKSLCKRLDIYYAELSPIDFYKNIMHELKETALEGEAELALRSNP